MKKFIAPLIMLFSYSIESLAVDVREFEYIESIPGAAAPTKYKMTEYSMSSVDFANWHQFGNESSYAGDIKWNIAPWSLWSHSYLADKKAPVPAGCFVYGPYAPLPVDAELSGEFDFHEFTVEGVATGTNPAIIDMEITAEGGTRLLATKTIFASDLGCRPGYPDPKSQVCSRQAPGHQKDASGMIVAIARQTHSINAGYVGGGANNLELRLCNLRHKRSELKLMNSKLRIKQQVP